MIYLLNATGSSDICTYEYVYCKFNQMKEHPRSLEGKNALGIREPIPMIGLEMTWWTLLKQVALLRSRYLRAKTLFHMSLSMWITQSGLHTYFISLWNGLLKIVMRILSPTIFTFYLSIKFFYVSHAYSELLKILIYVCIFLFLSP